MAAEMDTEKMSARIAEYVMERDASARATAASGGGDGGSMQEWHRKITMSDERTFVNNINLYLTNLGVIHLETLREERSAGNIYIINLADEDRVPKLSTAPTRELRREISRLPSIPCSYIVLYEANEILFVSQIPPEATSLPTKTVAEGRLWIDPDVCELPTCRKVRNPYRRSGWVGCSTCKKARYCCRAHIMEHHDEHGKTCLLSVMEDMSKSESTADNNAGMEEKEDVSGGGIGVSADSTDSTDDIMGFAATLSSDAADAVELFPAFAIDDSRNLERVVSSERVQPMIECISSMLPKLRAVDETYRFILSQRPGYAHVVRAMSAGRELIRQGETFLNLSVVKNKDVIALVVKIKNSEKMAHDIKSIMDTSCSGVTGSGSGSGTSEFECAQASLVTGFTKLRDRADTQLSRQDISDDNRSQLTDLISKCNDLLQVLDTVGGDMMGLVSSAERIEIYRTMPTKYIEVIHHPGTAILEYLAPGTRAEVQSHMTM